MGCKESKQAPPEVLQLEEESDKEEEIKPVDTTGMDAFQRFEYSFPLHRMQIQDFEARVKKLVFGKQSLTFKQFNFSFRGLKGWEDLENQDSLLNKILHSPYFLDEENKDELSVPSLLLWGLMLCPGDKNIKARVFYDILQDQLQESIAASDKDFDGSFDSLVFLATKMPNQFETEFSGSAPIKAEYNNLDDEKMEEIREEYLDEVFGAKSKMDRKEYIEKVKQDAPWIFSASDVRKKVDASL